jgi:hypothetical protein
MTGKKFAKKFLRYNICMAKIYIKSDEYSEPVKTFLKKYIRQETPHNLAVHEQNADICISLFTPEYPAEERFLGKFDVYGSTHLGILYSISDIGVREFIRPYFSVFPPYSKLKEAQEDEVVRMGSLSQKKHPKYDDLVNLLREGGSSNIVNDLEIGILLMQECLNRLNSESFLEAKKIIMI